MTDIGKRFAQSKQLIPYIMGGWPDAGTFAAVFKSLAAAGCGLIEVGVPYSDPLADGPTIQRASEAALRLGVTTDDVLDQVAEAADGIDISPVLMVYYNLIYRYGLTRFAERAAAARVQGVIVPDLTVEESADWRRAADKVGLETIFLVAPTSSDRRLEKIVDATTGFVYAVSLTGVTGARDRLPSYLSSFIGRVKSKTDLPVAVGFGISKPAQAEEVAGFADGVIVGSAIVNLIEEAGRREAADMVKEYVADLTKAVQGRREAAAT